MNKINMDNATLNKNLHASAAIAADDLSVTYNINVSTSSGHTAFVVKGTFELPSALHPAVRGEAEGDFELYLTKSIVNTSKILLAQFMRNLWQLENEARHSAQGQERKPPGNSTGAAVDDPLNDLPPLDSLESDTITNGIPLSK